MADLLAPLRCVSCGRTCGEDLCVSCADEVVAIRHPVCARCGAPSGVAADRCADLRGFDRARSLVAYAGPASRLVLALKRRGRADLAAAMGTLLASLARAHGLAGEGAVVTSVPAGASARGRGFDHAALLGRATASALGLPYRPLLVRRALGPRQADVPMEQRRANVRGRFAARGAAGHVLVVDDVFTTGSTAEACATVLRAAGSRSVDVLTWARTLRRGGGGRTPTAILRA